MEQEGFIIMKAAHIKEIPDGSYRIQSIQEHCENVALLAGSFASVFGAESIARYTGLLHDIGKYSDAFQRRINGSSEQVDHSTAGALVAWRSGTRTGLLAAFCIGGHHAGLPDLGTRFSDASDGTLLGKLRKNPEPFSEYENELTIESPSIPVWATENVNTAYTMFNSVFQVYVVFWEFPKKSVGPIRGIIPTFLLNMPL
jgi:CRISPR-associated endonuclease/helicase Cas3